MCVGVNHLREHKFRHNFRDTPNPICDCGHVLNLLHWYHYHVTYEFQSESALYILPECLETPCFSLDKLLSVRLQTKWCGFESSWCHMKCSSSCRILQLSTQILYLWINTFLNSVIKYTTSKKPFDNPLISQSIISITISNFYVSLSI